MFEFPFLDVREAIDVVDSEGNTFANETLDFVSWFYGTDLNVFGSNYVINDTESIETTENLGKRFKLIIDGDTDANYLDITGIRCIDTCGVDELLEVE